MHTRPKKKVKVDQHVKKKSTQKRQREKKNYRAVKKKEWTKRNNTSPPISIYDMCK